MKAIIEMIREFLPTAFAEDGARLFVRYSDLRYDERGCVLNMGLTSSGEFKVGDVVKFKDIQIFDVEEGPWISALINSDENFIIVAFATMKYGLKSWGKAKVKENFAVIVSEKMLEILAERSECICNALPSAGKSITYAPDRRPLWLRLDPILLFKTDWFENLSQQRREMPHIFNTGFGLYMEVIVKGENIAIQGSFSPQGISSMWLYAKDIRNNFREGAPVRVQLEKDGPFVDGTFVTTWQTVEFTRKRVALTRHGEIIDLLKLYGQWWGMEQYSMECPVCNTFPCQCDRVCAICGERIEPGDKTYLNNGLSIHNDGCRLLYTEEEIAEAKANTQ
ncbi:MAG: hypothetical protein ABIF08_01195 [Nanoarchaeota archaeon]